MLRGSDEILGKYKSMCKLFEILHELTGDDFTKEIDQLKWAYKKAVDPQMWKDNNLPSYSASSFNKLYHEYLAKYAVRKEKPEPPKCNKYEIDPEYEDLQRKL